ncbi:hypothetical protein Syun_023612 [Stephania yunnanensis]|uniref:Uncharacterized protein n=1 Tax=Stephania yunnanensis TaxID=152371 RepID=A0AAP0F9B6_9MAGN
MPVDRDSPRAPARDCRPTPLTLRSFLLRRHGSSLCSTAAAPIFSPTLATNRAPRPRVPPTPRPPCADAARLRDYPPYCSGPATPPPLLASAIARRRCSGPAPPPPRLYSRCLPSGNKAAIRYTGNICLIAKKRITPIYLTEEVFEHYKRMRATDETFKNKSEQMSSNRKSEVGGSGTGISLHSARSISARHHGDILEKKLQCRPTLKEMFRRLHTHGHDGQSFVDLRSTKIDAELIRRLEEMSTQTPNTSINEDVVNLEVMPEVKGCVYGLGSEGYHCSISLGGASSSRGPVYGSHEFEELQRDHQRLQATLLKEQMERQEQMQRDKMERQEENREMQDRLAPMEALLMQHLGIRAYVTSTPWTPPLPVIKRSGPQSDNHPGHLTTRDSTFSVRAPALPPA